MKKIYLCAIAIYSLCAIGCNRDTTAPNAPVPAASTAPDELQALGTQERDRTFDQSGICPRAWTCDFVHWYGTQSTCVAACGGQPCELEHRCGGACLCP
jgi:hypothetical protein